MCIMVMRHYGFVLVLFRLIRKDIWCFVLFFLGGSIFHFLSTLVKIFDPNLHLCISKCIPKEVEIATSNISF